MAGCTSSTHGAETSAPALLRALVEAYNRHAVEELIDLYDPEGVHEDVAGQRRKEGPVAISTGLGRFLHAVPDAHWALERVVGSGNGAVAPYVFQGTLREPLGDVEPRGQVIRLDAVLVVSVRDGLITRSRDYWDSGTFARQLRA
jgi:steroid delta-isomerase-like uncharacterized protein